MKSEAATVRLAAVPRTGVFTDLGLIALGAALVRELRL